MDETKYSQLKHAVMLALAKETLAHEAYDKALDDEQPYTDNEYEAFMDASYQLYLAVSKLTTHTGAML
jgi:hypothetical protein